MSPPPIPKETRVAFLDTSIRAIYGNHAIRPSNIHQHFRKRAGVKFIAIIDIIVYLIAAIPMGLKMWGSSLKRSQEDMKYYNAISPTDASLSFDIVINSLFHGESCLREAFLSENIQVPLLFVIVRVTNIIYDIGAVVALWAIPLAEAACLLHTTLHDEEEPQKGVVRVMEWLITAICFFFFHLFQLIIYGPYWIPSGVFVLVRILSLKIVTDYGQELDAVPRMRRQSI